MYRRSIPGQIKLDIPYNVELNPESRWVRIADLFPWDRIEEMYEQNFSSNEGQIAKPSRLAFAALYIQASEGFTDEKTVENIQENPHMQYFCGFTAYTPVPPFDASMMVHFRKRISSEMVMKITEEVFAPEAIKEMDAPIDVVIATEDAQLADVEPNQEGTESSSLDANATQKPKNRGTLILDATCCPQDIRYPTDMGLLNQARELCEQIIDILYGIIIDQFDYKPRTYREVARRDYLEHARSRKPTKKSIRKSIRKQLQYVNRDLKIIKMMVDKGAPLNALGKQLYIKLLVIGEVYRQQKEMYDTRTNRCDDRIVSISQPHIRPIVRGKADKPTEFGAKVAIALVGGYAFITDISWSNTAEATLLAQAAEQYKAMFGFYPAVIIGDGVYSNLKNREWCKSRHIRLSGKKLGRKNEEIRREEAKQLHKDGCERNAVEGKFGETKRKYSLGLIMPKLPDTSKTVIAMGFFVANMERKLRLLFASQNRPFVFYDFECLSLSISDIYEFQYYFFEAAV